MLARPVNQFALLTQLSSRLTPPVVPSQVCPGSNVLACKEPLSRELPGDFLTLKWGDGGPQKQLLCLAVTKSRRGKLVPCNSTGARSLQACVSLIQRIRSHLKLSMYNSSSNPNGSLKLQLDLPCDLANPECPWTHYEGQVQGHRTRLLVMVGRLTASHSMHAQLCCTNIT